MRMSIDHVPAVVGEFFDTVLVPAAQARSGLLAFTTGFAASAAKRQAGQMAQAYLPTAKALGYVDDGGSIDIDTAYEDACQAIEKGRPTLMGYTFDRADIDRLRDIMRKHGF